MIWNLASLLFTSQVILVMSDSGGYTHLEPSGHNYLTVGDPFELVCTYSGKGNSSHYLSIERCRDRKCNPLSSELVNSSSIQAFIPSLQGEGNYTYTCSYQREPGMSITYVRVGYPPSPPEDIYCFSLNHRDMNCTVKLAQRDIKSNFYLNITFQFRTLRLTHWLECPNYQPQYHSCYWSPPGSSGQVIDNVFVINRLYTVMVTMENVLGSVQLERRIEDTREIVKITKLHQFRATNVSSRDAYLTWMVPESLLPVTFVIDFVIRYTSKWDHSKVVYSSKNKMVTKLYSLIPNTQYNVSIRARSQLVSDDRSWSSVSRISFKTKKDAPGAAPRTTIGGYFIPRRESILTEQSCKVYIYTKPVPPKQRNGRLSDIRYHMSLQDEEAPTYAHTGPTTTISINLPSCWGGPYDIAIRACNGALLCSHKRTFVHIPFIDKGSNDAFPRPVDVIAEGFGDTRFKVSWTIPLDVDEHLIRGVTVFWCRGSKEDHFCESNMSWKKIKELVSSAEVTVKQSSYRDWMFAVSFITHNGDSGGMVFEDCQFLYDKSQSGETTGTVKPSFHLISRGEKEGKATDIVSLTFRFCDAQFLYRKPEQYEVFYKQTQGNADKDCIIGAESLNVTATTRVQEIVLPDLDPMSLYSVCMRIRTSVGTSALSDVRWRKPLESPDNFSKAGIALASIGSMLGLILLLLLAWCSRRRYKALDAAIDIPDIDKDCQSATEKLITSKESNVDSGIDSHEDTIYTSAENKNHETRQPTSEISEDREDSSDLDMRKRNSNENKIKHVHKDVNQHLLTYCQADRKTDTESDVTDLNRSDSTSILVPPDPEEIIVRSPYKAQLDTRCGNLEASTHTSLSSDSDMISDESLSDLGLGLFEDNLNMVTEHEQHGYQGSKRKDQCSQLKEDNSHLCLRLKKNISIPLSKSDSRKRYVKTLADSSNVYNKVSPSEDESYFERLHNTSGESEFMHSTSETQPSISVEELHEHCSRTYTNPHEHCSTSDTEEQEQCSRFNTKPHEHCSRSDTKEQEQCSRFNTKPHDTVPDLTRRNKNTVLDLIQNHMNTVSRSDTEEHDTDSHTHWSRSDKEPSEHFSSLCCENSVSLNEACCRYHENINDPCCDTQHSLTAKIEQVEYDSSLCLERRKSFADDIDSEHIGSDCENHRLLSESEFSVFTDTLQSSEPDSSDGHVDMSRIKKKTYVAKLC
ncbi:uncharacterized protein [Argopecten irradians]|uniref:uncharacterized protein isoform X2 n=1 Tax=Argopecten irradians TaxID=31199 RepID=UPI00371D0C45